MNFKKNDEQERFGKLIFEIEGAIQKKKGLFGKRTTSHLAFYEKGIIIQELGDYIEILKRNVANVYYSAPMVGDYDCVTIEIDHYDEGELNTYPLDEDTWDGIFARVDRLLDNEWSEFRKLKTGVPDSVKWFNAVNAVIAIAGEYDPELFGGEIKSPDSAVRSRDVLYEFWDVNVRQDLLDWFEKLYAGRSAEQANEVIEELKAVGTDLNSLCENDRRELEWKQGKNAIAWDMGRVIWIASLGYHADYLTYDEAISYCTKAGKELQSLFHGWGDMFVNYMQGFIYSWDEDPDDEESESNKRLRIYSWLKTIPNSPYKTDWNTNL